MSNKPQRFIQNEQDEGYRVLHPTRGWRTVSAKRAKLYLPAYMEPINAGPERVAEPSTSLT